MTPLHLIFFYITVLLLPTQIGYHMWPDWSLILGRRIDYLSPTIFLTDITICMTLISWGISKRHSIIKSLQQFFRNYAAILIPCLIVLLTNIMYSTSLPISLYKWTKIIEYVCFGFYIYKTKPSFRTTAICLAIAVLYSSTIAIAQLILQRSVGGALWFLGERMFSYTTPGIAKTNWCWITTSYCNEIIRPYATFSHPNVLGGFFATCIPIFGIAAYGEKRKQVRRFFLFTLILTCIILGLTLSRSAWIIGMIAVISTAYSIPLKSKHKTGIFVFLISFIGIALPYFLMLNGSQESVFVRLDLLTAAGMLIKQHPLIGTGLGTFLIELPHVLSSRDLFFIQPVHNIYALYITETGIAGIFLLYLLLKKYILFLKNHSVRIICILPLLLLFGIGLVDHYPATIQQGQLLFTLVIAMPFFKYTYS